MTDVPKSYRNKNIQEYDQINGEIRRDISKEEQNCTITKSQN